MAAILCIALLVACERAPEPAETPDDSQTRAEVPARSPTAPAARAPQAVPPPAPRPTPPSANVTERLREIEEIPFKDEDPRRAVSELRPHLTDADLDVREAAVMALAEVEGEPANEALSEFVRTESDSMLKIDMVDELIDREAPQALDTLLYILADTDPEVRERAADGLDELGDPRAVPALHDALQAEQDEFVRDAILFALSSLDPDFDEEQYELEE
jgi:hypothetical protein